MPARSAAAPAKPAAPKGPAPRRQNATSRNANRALAAVPDPAKDKPAEAPAKPEAPKAFVVAGTYTFDRYQGQVTVHTPDGKGGYTKKVEKVDSRYGHITREAAEAAARTYARTLGLEVRSA